MKRRQQRMQARFGEIQRHHRWYPGGRYLGWTTGGRWALRKVAERAQAQWVRIQQSGRVIDLGYIGDDEDYPKFEDCRVYWGTHGCDLDRGHAGDCVCECALDRDDDPDVLNVGAPPYYGPDTRFYGEDAATRGLPTLEA